jgi:hypothetical protein
MGDISKGVTNTKKTFMLPISGLNRGLPQLGVGKSSKHRKPLLNLLQGSVQPVYQPYLKGQEHEMVFSLIVSYRYLG